jgi:hypothetical protein
MSSVRLPDRAPWCRFTLGYGGFRVGQTLVCRPSSLSKMQQSIYPPLATLHPNNPHTTNPTALSTP